MRIPTNSTFSKEIAKQFKRIFIPRYDFKFFSGLQEFTGTN
jgi:hypothetical protein